MFSRAKRSSSASNGATGIATCDVVGKAMIASPTNAPDSAVRRLRALHHLDEVNRGHSLRAPDPLDSAIDPVRVWPGQAFAMEVQRFGAKQKVAA